MFSLSPNLALLFETIKRFVDVRVHEAIYGIAGMDVGQVKIVGADSLQTCFNCSHNVFDRGGIAQMSPSCTKLGDDTQLISLIASNSLAQSFFRTGPRVIR